MMACGLADVIARWRRSRVVDRVANEYATSNLDAPMP